MTTPAAKAIVRAKKYNNLTGLLFLMSKDDHRYGTENYVHIADGKLTNERLVAGRDMRMRVFAATDGRRFGVFSDYSARQLRSKP